MGREQEAARRFLAVVQDPRGYPPPGAALELGPFDGPALPVIHSVVLADEYDRLREALAGVVAARDDGEFDAAVEIARSALSPESNPEGER